MSTITHLKDLTVAGYTGALDWTWRNPYVTNGVIGGMAAGAVLSGAAALGASRTSSVKWTNKIQSIATRAASKIPFLTNVQRYLGPAIFAAKVYDYAYPTSPISTILRPTIEPVQKTRVWLALGLISAAATISHVASAPIMPAIRAIPAQDRTPKNVGQATMRAMAQHIAHSVITTALLGAAAYITVEAGKKIAWHFIQRKLFGSN